MTNPAKAGHHVSQCGTSRILSYVVSAFRRTRTREAAGELALAAAAHGLGVNQMKLVHAGGERIAVARTEEGYAAFQDRCTHKGGPLSDGALMCGTVQCPWHGSQFDVRTGEVKCGPAEKKIRTYPIEEQPAKTA